MAYKNRMTVADILIALRQQLLTAHTEKNKEKLKRLESYLESMWEIAALANDSKALVLLEDLTYAASHFIMEVDFKALEALPSIEAIHELESTAAKYQNVSAKLICRVVVRKELHPLDIGFHALTEEKIEPDWIGIAFTQGPYQDTFDTLFYNLDGRLISWHQCDTLEQALSYVEQHCGIEASEWETCEIDLTAKDGEFIWKLEEK
jgi:hypothetical protein